MSRATGSPSVALSQPRPGARSSSVALTAHRRLDSARCSGAAGWVAERFKAAVLKTANPQGFVGSNPTPSVWPLSPTVPGHAKNPAFPGKQQAYLSLAIPQRSVLCQFMLWDRALDRS
jgi:hypothetical protein